MSNFGASRTTAPSGNGYLGPLPLVGRARELAALEALMETPAEGTSVVIITGEGGVGKSRLALELGERADRRGWNVTHGRAFPVESGVPYALFSDAFLPILNDMDPDTLTVLSRGGERELRYLFPALGQADEPSDVGGDPDEFRTRLMWNFAEFLKSYAARQPLLCVLEDLQWADESSLQLLHFLGRQSAGHPILIVCTYNDTQRDQSLELVRTERSLVSLGVGELRRLAPLAHEQVTELVRLTFGVDAEVVREFSALLYGWTRGNPFFLEEILKSLIASGRLSKQAGAWVGWDAEDFSLPGSIRDAVLARLGATSQDAQTVAELTAIIGARARYPLLASVSGLDERALLDALEELCDSRILEERAEAGTVVYDFTHPLVRQTLYNEFGLQRARVLHGVVAEAMEGALRRGCPRARGRARVPLPADRCRKAQVQGHGVLGAGRSLRPGAPGRPRGRCVPSSCTREGRPRRFRSRRDPSAGGPAAGASVPASRQLRGRRQTLGDRPRAHRRGRTGSRRAS